MQTVRVRANEADNVGGRKKNPFFDSPGSEVQTPESFRLDSLRTPGSNGSKVVTFESSIPLEPVSPPKIERLSRLNPPPVEKINISSSPCDSSTWATSISNEITPSSVKVAKEKKVVEIAMWEMSSTLKKKIKSMKKVIPKIIQAMQRTTPKQIDLSELSVATLCLMPRNGAGMEEGRKCFERMRTSLMLHMIQKEGNGSWVKQDKSKYEGEKGRKLKGQTSKLQNNMHDCISSRNSSFVEKTQEIVRIVKEAKESIEEIDDVRGEQSASKKAVSQRNMTCLKLLSGMYRDVVSSYEANDACNDGLTLMVVASAYFAMGRFEKSLTVYQKAGAQLKDKICTSPEYIVHCAKLFNNMGCVYYEMNKYEKAMQTFQRALQLFHDENEENYSYWVSSIVDQASIMNNMAYTLIKFKQYDDASDLVDASFELQHLLPWNPNMDNNILISMTVSNMSSMAFIYQRTKKYKMALDTYSACAHLQSKGTIHSDYDKAEILKKMAETCKKVKNHEKRVNILRCVLLYQQTYLEEDDDEIWETNAALGQALEALAEMDSVSV